jgi:drug/metabolite transporter (DMT)-like permease
MPDRPALPYLVLAGGVLIVSSASILIRVAQAEGAPSLTIAAARLGIASLILTPFAWGHARDALRSATPGDLGLALISGALLAVHFWSWITSLAHTSVASSTALVTTNPLWVGLASVLVFRERLTAPIVAGMGLCLAGTALIFAGDSSAASHVAGGQPMLGNALALLGALSASGYLLIGRTLRDRVSLLSYIWVAYSSAAVLLWLAVLATGHPVQGLPRVAYLCMLGLAIGPQLLGHTAFTWSLRHLTATFVAVSILGEPVGSALLAWIIFGERLAGLPMLGFVLLLAGIFLAARAERPAIPKSSAGSR